MSLIKTTYNRIIGIVANHRDETLSVLFILLFLGMVVGVAGTIYLEKRLDMHEDISENIALAVGKVLNGELPVIDKETLGIGNKGEFIQSNLFYIQKIRELEARLAELESKVKATPPPVPALKPKFSL